MVLLTSSAISVVISSAVVCTFTFLLFLSGYVLQQQTVRSLQDALHRPSEIRPSPILPKAFQEPENETGPIILDETEALPTFKSVLEDLSASNQNIEQIQVHLEPEGLQQSTIQESPEDSVKSPKVKDPEVDLIDGILPPKHLAYILTIPNPSDLCSAVIFAKQQRKYNQLKPQPSIRFLYPVTWETGTDPSFQAALSLLRDVQDELSITYHPVTISSVWEGVAIEPQLLGELQRRRWDYDRALYLRIPGYALDTTKLDKVLASSSLKKSWAPLQKISNKYPEILMLSAVKGMMTPRTELRQLTISASGSTVEAFEDKEEFEEAISDAAYIIFDNGESTLDQVKGEWTGRIFERFERERNALCSPRGL